MKLMLHDLRGRPEGMAVSGRVSVDEVARRDRSVAAVEPVQVELEAREISPGVFQVDGTLKTRVAYRCSRCLAEFWEPLETPFHERFVRLPTPAGEWDQEDDMTPIESDEVDLAPYVEQALILALPWRPLCRPQCRGLCPECGANLNEGPCGCSDRATDPRWEKLGELWKGISGSSGGSG
ncbi:DUF177 domain-containing protein [Kyrpidia sp.]|uniref:YceD family protein n=1 Tax=Kyrpidia sp. TaxID=2073077 RepID=UPI002586135C|nr:DUF177 domain-containing protein [Kyrpidia sp.]MCL6575954.1 DUF177 domain-containing protein [Kyrpidia sp.]